MTRSGIYAACSPREKKSLERNLTLRAQSPQSPPMTLSGLSDSLASVIADAPSCPRCDSSSHIAGGLCVGCLLQSGLDPDDDCQADALVSALAEINLPDQNWRLGNYEILEEIGRGGMGVIYRARQRHSRRIVAVKRVLSYHSDSRETLARFRREAQAAASLDHPNILPIYEVSESEDGLPFFSMKFAPGGNLQEVGPALRNDPRQCVALVAKVVRAVQYAHAKGILHRDLKPGNILLDARGEPMVSDFGLAKWLDTTSDLTRTLTIFGTPGYIAPEQASASAAELTPTGDIYSLGAILFDLLAGRPPFLGAHALSVIRQAAESPAPKLRTLSKIADRDLETICARCLERDPKLRYPSAHDLAEDLERWLDGRPIIARPVLPPVRAWRWSKRNPRLGALAAAVMMLLTVVAALRLENHASQQATLADMRSIAVEPLLDLDTAQLNPKLSNTLVAALQSQLQQKGPARIVATSGSGTSVVNTKNAPKPSGFTPRTILRGTQRSWNGKLRLSLRLLNATDERVVYRQIIDNAVPEEAAHVAVTLMAAPIYATLNTPDLSSVEATEADRDPGWRNQTTREFLIAGRAVQERRTLEDINRAIELFDKAGKAEPSSALAFSRLAEAQSTRYFLTGETSYLAAAETSATHAANLNPKLSHAHAALALVRYRQGRFRESLEETFIACEVADTDNAGFEFRAAENWKMLGQPDRALGWYRFILNKGNRPGLNEFMIGDCLSDLTDDENASVAYRRASALFPELPEGWMGLCRLALLQKNFAIAANISSENSPRYREFVFSAAMAAQVEFFSRNFPEAEKLYQDLAATDPNGGGSFYGAVTYQSVLGRLRSEAGDKENGRRMLERALAHEVELHNSAPQHPEILYRMAAIEASLGSVAAALRHLQQAVDSGWVDYRSTELDPRFDRIRNEPEFQNIISTTAERIQRMRLTLLKKNDQKN